MVKIKVCGITNLADAQKALELGADALGFNFYPLSPRCITPENARAILERIPQSALNVAVFVNEPKETVDNVLEAVNGDRRAFSHLQFHGEESAEYCRRFDLKIIKAFRIKEKRSLENIENFSADFYLLDSWSPGFGGSGDSFPWEWLDHIDTSKLILSGGLHAGNVVDAIRRVHPYGVDVCSGIEASPGIKDHAKLKEFIVAAKNA
jgi:phosphoribosylanthranilate isomerase